MLTQAIVRELLHYDPETGALTWLPRDRRWFSMDRIWRAWNTRYAGKSAEQRTNYGYSRTIVFDQFYQSHRLIWLYMTGEWPAADIDHIDRDRPNNRWANLREASRSENLWNTTARPTNTSGFKGVFRNGKRWMARIRAEGRIMYLGTFDTPEGASLAYRWAAERYHREFAGA